MNTLLLVVLLLVVSAILGLYRGWPCRSPENTHRNASAAITVPRKKTREDEDKTRLQEFGHKSKRTIGGLRE